MPTKADHPRDENRTSKEAAEIQTSIPIESELTAMDTVRQPMRRAGGLNGGENA